MASVNKVKDDTLKHFANDGPRWKLAALFINKLPYVLAGLASLLVAVVKVAGWLALNLR